MDRSIGIHAAQGQLSPRRWLDARAPASVVEHSLQSLGMRLRAAHELARPGFMALRAVRRGDCIVDFAWNFVSTAAGRILGHNAVDLYGKRLRLVLAGQDSNEALFEQYRSVWSGARPAPPSWCIERMVGATSTATAPCALATASL
jgi:hypothetical protein